MLALNRKETVCWIFQFWKMWKYQFLPVISVCNNLPFQVSSSHLMIIFSLKMLTFIVFNSYNENFCITCALYNKYLLLQCSLLIQISVSMITSSAKGSLLPSVPCPVYWQTSYWITLVSASFSVTLHAIDQRLLGPSQALKLVPYLNSDMY